MLVLITYDVNTEDAAGRKRLRQIAKFPPKTITSDCFLLWLFSSICKKSQKTANFAKDASKNLCIFAVAPHRGSVG